MRCRTESAYSEKKLNAVSESSRLEQFQGFGVLLDILSRNPLHHVEVLPPTLRLSTPLPRQFWSHNFAQRPLPPLPAGN
jgi:hypothetical protein